MDGTPTDALPSLQVRKWMSQKTSVRDKRWGASRGGPGRNNRHLQRAFLGGATDGAITHGRNGVRRKRAAMVTAGPGQGAGAPGQRQGQPGRPRAAGRADDRT